MNIQTLSPQGYNINDNPMNHNPFWTQGTYTAKIWINVDDSPIEPGFGFILKSVFNSNNVRVTSHYGYVEATLNTAEAYDLQPVNNSLYMFAQHDLIYSADAGTVEFTINLTSASAPPVTDTHPVLIRHDGTGTPNSTLTKINDTTWTLTLSNDDTDGFLLGLNETESDPVYSLTLPTAFTYNFACTAFLVEGRLFFVKPGGSDGQFQYPSFTITYDNVTYTINVQ